MEAQHDTVDIITRHFPDLTQSQIEAFGRLEALYTDWNAKINVISRSDTGNLYTRHVLHSLAIAKFLGNLPEGVSFMDLGTGGGLPGIPLAIFYPQCRFHLIDRIGKKIRVASDIADQTGLANVTFQHGDSGECHQTFDYVVSRAVMPLDALVKACSRNIRRDKLSTPPGLICLKGGDLDDEIKATKKNVVDVPVSDYFSEEFFGTKHIIYVPL